MLVHEQLIIYADNVTFVASRINLNMLVSLLNDALNHSSIWLSENNLHSTTGKNSKRYPFFNTTKLLGFHVDRKVVLAVPYQKHLQIYGYSKFVNLFRINYE